MGDDFRLNFAEIEGEWEDRWFVRIVMSAMLFIGYLVGHERGIWESWGLW